MSIMGRRSCAIAWSGTRRSATINLRAFITVALPELRSAGTIGAVTLKLSCERIE
jgi:hypothetical protein